MFLWLRMTGEVLSCSVSAVWLFSVHLAGLDEWQPAVAGMFLWLRMTGEVLIWFVLAV
jgi:hypothetical protein